ncbi:hypothetical protein NDR87_28825 [Nocardia sp. CDC159]|uniref:Uncharacterized protein n=1 Tax=Nocardia pulmonis TaxID=2951408 RepID=A0A9X2EG06_9NOCA|nr:MULTISPECIES: hypothetical protein [Nocardia]MCM6777508.1 hypothetical protein [Nocardia pulmonis]MCM6790385.1 hypothetical protein [Nocardia sp. CDC159]
MSEPGPVPSERPPVWERIGLDWWAVIVAGVITLAAVTGVLPTIPW